MNLINLILFFFLFTIISNKGGGHGSSAHGSSSHSSSGSHIGSSRSSGTSRRVGSLRNGFRIRFTSSGRYGRSKLWFSNHYVNIHYTGHHNYYKESDYNEEDYADLNEDIYLIYVINGTFLNNHLKISYYHTDGHYITFSEYLALSDFLENITEFQNIFGNDTRVIMSKNYLINNNNDNITNMPIIDFIDEDIYQKVMIDVVTDVHYVPFYKLFPNFHVDKFLYFLSYIPPIILFIYIIYFFYKYNYYAFRELDVYHLFIFILLLLFIGYIKKDFHMRNNYLIYLHHHSFNSIFFILWQILQLYFIYSLISHVIKKDRFLIIFCCFYFILLILEYCLIEQMSSILIIIIFLKILFFSYLLYSLNEYRKLYLYAKYVELQSTIVEKEIFIKKFNTIFTIIILLIIFEFLLLLDNGSIFYYIQLYNFLVLIGFFFFENYINNYYINLIIGFEK